MFNLHLSAEQLEIRDTVRDFVEREVKPPALKPERLEAFERPLLMGVLDKASQMGLRTLALSEERGGAAADHLTCAIVIEELAAGDPDIAAVLAQTSRLGHILFDHLMNNEQRDRFLPKFLADDRYHLALAELEPETETALGVNYHRPVALEAPIGTTAQRSGNDWIVNGVKDCVANAPIAKLIAVLVRTGPSAAGSEPGVLLVPRETLGLTVRPHAGGRHHGACGQVLLKDCRVPANNLLGAPASAALLGEAPAGANAPSLAAVNLGIGRAAYEAALDYAQLRVQGGRPIVEHQAIGTKLAEMAIKLEVARTAVWKAAWASDHPQAHADRSLADLPLQAMAKAFTAEAMYQVAKSAAECFGAMGVMRDMPLQKYVHDALVCLHAGDGAADAKLRIAEALVGFRRPAAARAQDLALAGE